MPTEYGLGYRLNNPLTDQYVNNYDYLNFANKGNVANVVGAGEAALPTPVAAPAASYNYGNSGGGVMDWIKTNFTPDANGYSLGGNVLKGASDAVGILGGLAGTYFDYKKMKAAENADKRAAAAEQRAIAKQNQFESNMYGTV